MVRKETRKISVRSVLALLLAAALVYFASGGSAAKTAKADPWSGRPDVVCKIDEDTFPDEVIRMYVKNDFDTNGDGSLDEAEIANATSLSITYETFRKLCAGKFMPDNEIEDLWGQTHTLQGLDCLSALNTLWITGFPLEEADISGFYNLFHVRFSHCGISSIRFSETPWIVNLDVCGNRLTNLDVSKIATLYSLDCSDNQLTRLNVRNNSSLKSLNCEGNRIAELDVSRCEQLYTLLCANNDMSSLNLSRSFDLEEFSCDHNQLEELDLSRCNSLQSLSCGFNKLTTLNLSRKGMLTVLNCESNRLRELKLDSCEELQALTCPDNELTSLDVSKCENLFSVDCRNNRLTSLLLPVGMKMRHLLCEGNRLASINLRGVGALSNIEQDSLTDETDAETNVRTLVSGDSSGNPYGMLTCDGKTALATQSSPRIEVKFYQRLEGSTEEPNCFTLFEYQGNCVEEELTAAAAKAFRHSGYVLDGWYWDENFTEKAQLPIVVVEPVSLYGIWRKAPEVTATPTPANRKDGPDDRKPTVTPKPSGDKNGDGTKKAADPTRFDTLLGAAAVVLVALSVGIVIAKHRLS